MCPGRAGKRCGLQDYLQKSVPLCHALQQNLGGTAPQKLFQTETQVMVGHVKGLAACLSPGKFIPLQDRGATSQGIGMGGPDDGLHGNQRRLAVWKA